MYYIPFYAIISIFVMVGLVNVFFPRWIARWDFHYNERENPSPLYLLKCRITGVTMLAVVIGLIISMYVISCN